MDTDAYTTDFSFIIAPLSYVLIKLVLSI